MLSRFICLNENEYNRNLWLQRTLAKIPSGSRILDAGAGELRNKEYCSHLTYVSQDFCKYEGRGDGLGLHTGEWNTKNIDIICDISSIPEPDNSFDVILCSEVFEHLPDASMVIGEFSRLLKRDGVLIITAPFASLVHFSPYHYVSGFSRYWYEYHLPRNDFDIKELSPNGDWFSYARQESFRLPRMARQYRDWCWPVAYVVAAFSGLYFVLRGVKAGAEEIACFGWHCVAIKR
ncbi:MAG: methyltransferase domain-containing protein [Thermodesulfobacteriota bacterium]